MKKYIYIIICFAFFLPVPLNAAGFVLRLGPAGIGNGGPNPLGIPPGLIDMEFSIITKKGFESNFAITGLLFGDRITSKWGGYVSLGGGLVLDANGGGPGIYSAFGWDFGGKLFKFNVEYKQSLGHSGSSILSPYALRLGAGLWFN